MSDNADVGAGKDAGLRKVYLDYLEAANARELHRMAEFAHDTVVFNGEPVSRDDYVAADQAGASNWMALSVSRSIRR